MVIGTTGFTPEQRTAIATTAEQMAIVLCNQLRLGPNRCLPLNDTANRLVRRRQLPPWAGGGRNGRPFYVCVVAA